MKVLKFGGGCFKNSSSILKAAAVIQSEEDPPVVVVSALYGITDLILQGIQQAGQSEKYIPSVLKAITVYHLQLLEETMADKKQQEATSREVSVRIEQLKRLFLGIAYTQEIVPTIKAKLLSYGERLSAVVLAGIICGRGKKAVALEADKIGMITDASWENATILSSETSRNLSQHVIPLVRHGIIPIVTGYFGCCSDGRITTFGRNGTDYSAAAIAQGIRADRLEIWKDVNGFMSADPQLVPQARKINELSYYEAAELSYFGAGILHPRTVEPLLNETIDLCIKNLSHPGNQGTRLQKSGYQSREVIKSVTCNRNICRLKIQGPGVGNKPGIIALIGSALASEDINIISIITSQTCINLLIDQQDSEKSYAALHNLDVGIIDHITKDNSLALVAVVGTGLQQQRGIAARVFSTVAAQKINIEMISSGASEVAAYFIVAEALARKAVQAIHNEFFKENIHDQNQIPAS